MGIAIEDLIKFKYEYKPEELVPRVIVGDGFEASEQLRGYPKYQSDIYALGVMIIYVMTGKHPSTLEIDKYNGNLIWHDSLPSNVTYNKNLLDIIDKMIEYDDRKRYQSASDILKDLESINISTNNIFSKLKQSKSNNYKLLGIWKMFTITGVFLAIVALSYLVIHNSQKVEHYNIDSLKKN